MTLSPSLVETVAIAFLVAAACGYWARSSRAHGAKLPPGPPGLPLIGNLFDLPKAEEWMVYKAMSDKYDSSIIHLRFLGTSIIVLHDLKSARDLMEKRSSLYSDRPYSVMVCELMGWSRSIPFAKYSDLWRSLRKAIHQEFKSLAVHNFHASQTNYTRELLQRLVQSPDRWLEHLHYQTAGISLDTAYGIEIASENDPYVKIMEQALLGVLAAAVPGAFLVDILPWLKYVPAWVPGAGFQRKAQAWELIQQSSVNNAYNACKKAISEGSTKSSYCSRHLARLDSSQDSSAQQIIIRETAAVVYGAGFETTVSVLATFFLAMVLYPEVQAKAQAEIDAVIGVDRLPTFGDEASLPYLSAIVTECLRWKEVLPLGVPHRLMADDYYDGYLLPAGSIIMANNWAILHDERAYPDPFVFKPERFMKDGKLDPAVQDPELAAFGYGRRVCPGRHMARNSVWITLASVLATFRIEKAVDADGRPITPSERYVVTLTSHPEPFPCAVTPRSKRAKDMILSITDHNAD